MDVSCQFRVALRINLYDSVEKFRDTCSVTAYGRTYRHSQKVAQLLGIQLVTFRLQFVIHIQSHYDSEVHIDYLRRQIKIPFDVGCVHHVDYDIGNILDKIFADVEFLRAVC